MMNKKIILREDQLEDLIDSLDDFENEGVDDGTPCRCNDFSLIYNTPNCEVGCEDHGGSKIEEILTDSLITRLLKITYSSSLKKSSLSNSFS